MKFIGIYSPKGFPCSNRHFCCFYCCLTLFQCVYIYVWISSCMYICPHKQPQTNTYQHTYTYVYVYIHTEYTHTQRKRGWGERRRGAPLGLPQLPFSDYCYYCLCFTCKVKNIEFSQIFHIYYSIHLLQNPKVRGIFKPLCQRSFCCSWRHYLTHRFWNSSPLGVYTLLQFDSYSTLISSSANHSTLFSYI